MASSFPAQWSDTLRNAQKYPFAAGRRIDKPDQLVPNGDWLQDPTCRVYYDSYIEILERASKHIDLESKPILIVTTVTIGTLESPKVQTAPEADILRSSNLHLSWGVNPNNTQSYSAHMMYAPQFSIFKKAGHTRPRPLTAACLSVQLPVQPQTIINNGATEYREPHDAAAIAAIFDGVFRSISALDHPVVIFADVGLAHGHPPSQIARILRSGIEKYSVPLVLFALGSGDYLASDPAYVEFYNAIRC